MAKGRVTVVPAEFRNFDGGWNVADSPFELEQNESSLLYNITMDNFGGITPRLGTTDLNAGSRLPARPDTIYPSYVANVWLAYIKSTGGVAKLYKSADSGATWTLAYAFPNPSAGPGAIVDFNGRVVVVNDADGVYSFPSNLAAPTHTAGGTNNMEVPKGQAIAIWQNKLWIPLVNSPRLYWSKAGDELTWTAGTDYIDIREVDERPLTAIGAGQGMDVTAQPGLIVCKNHSVYRVNDSGTGEYTTLSARDAGAANPQAVASTLGVICLLNDKGVWVTDGVSQPVYASRRVAPFITLRNSVFASSGWTAVPIGERILFFMGDVYLEFHPQKGWFVPHAYASSPGAMAVNENGLILGGSYGTTGMIVQVNSGSNFDNATAIPYAFRTKHEELASGHQARLRRLRLWGRGTIDNVGLSPDFAPEDVVLGAPSPSPLVHGGGTVALGAQAFGGGSTATYYPVSDLELYLDDVCKFVAFTIYGNAPAVFTLQPMGEGSKPVGGCALYGLELDYVPLGLS